MHEDVREGLGPTRVFVCLHTHLIALSCIWNYVYTAGADKRSVELVCSRMFSEISLQAATRF